MTTSGDTVRIPDPARLTYLYFRRFVGCSIAAPAEVITDPGEVAWVESLIKHKYGLEFRVVTLVKTSATLGRKPRVVLRITPSSLT
jgi:hypothetical protein